MNEYYLVWFLDLPLELFVSFMNFDRVTKVLKYLYYYFFYRAHHHFNQFCFSSCFKRVVLIAMYSKGVVLWVSYFEVVTFRASCFEEVVYCFDYRAFKEDSDFTHCHNPNCRIRFH
jgi:hypothetical protein